MRLTYAAATHPGNVRENNQDSYYIDGEVSSGDKSFHKGEGERDWMTAAVCDGVGGLDNGAEASKMATRAIKDADGPALADRYTDFARELNRAVCERSVETDTEMGTTLALISVDHDRVIVCNIGDSRVYRFRNSRLEQLSEDHTRIRSMLDAGLLTEEQIPGAAKELGHQLTQYLGVPEKDFLISPYVAEPAEVSAGDIYILCSDGLTDMAGDEEIRGITDRYKDAQPEEILMWLMQAASRNGGEDNITIAVVKAERQKMSHRR